MLFAEHGNERARHARGSGRRGPERLGRFSGPGASFRLAAPTPTAAACSLTLLSPAPGYYIIIDIAVDKATPDRHQPQILQRSPCPSLFHLIVESTMRYCFYVRGLLWIDFWKCFLDVKTSLFYISLFLDFHQLIIIVAVKYVRRPGPGSPPGPSLCRAPAAYERTPARQQLPCHWWETHFYLFITKFY